MKTNFPLLLLIFVLIFTGCQKQTDKNETTEKKNTERNALTQKMQGNLTKEEIIKQFKEGNGNFLKHIKDDSSYKELLITTSTEGQFPKAIVLSCIDSRAPVEAIFDKNIGDVFTSRVAGNYADSGVIGGIEYACKVVGAKVIIVMGHTDCGAIKGACDNVEMGNLNYVIEELRPSVDSVKGYDNDRTSKNKEFVKSVTKKNVELTINKIRNQSKIISDLEKEGKVKLIGAVYNVADGNVDFLE